MKKGSTKETEPYVFVVIYGSLTGMMIERINADKIRKMCVCAFVLMELFFCVSSLW
jgi:hypothetical protein